MTKSDKILISLIITLSLLGYGFFFHFPRQQTDSPRQTEISVNGDTIATLDLALLPADPLLEFTVPHGTCVAEVKPGAIRMQSSPCPDQYCMRQGWIDRPGQTIICVPNRVIIRIHTPSDIVDTISH